MTTQIKQRELPRHVALACAGCSEPIVKSQQSVSAFIGHHTATEACNPQANHWHVKCEPAQGMRYLSHERSKAG